MSIKIVQFVPTEASRWDEFCASAINSSFLHTRHFLNYHGGRYQDLSLMVVENGKLVGVLPAAQSPSNEAQVVTHPGITYGGIVHTGKLVGMKMLETLSAVCAWYSEKGYSSLLYKVLPHIYAKAPAQDDLYALFRLGAERVRCDLSCAIDLTARLEQSQRRKRGFKKASEVVTISNEPHLLESFWQILEDNLERKHAARPVHSLAEMKLLTSFFPHNISISCALIDGRVEAGVLFFNGSIVWHAQYIAASAKAYEVGALDAVFESAIKRAAQDGVRYFDFGTSNEDAGWKLNDGLYRFKSEFGAAGVAHEFFELRLNHE